jgi:hypothetical protein
MFILDNDKARSFRVGFPEANPALYFASFLGVYCAPRPLCVARAGHRALPAAHVLPVYVVVPAACTTHVRLLAPLPPLSAFVPLSPRRQD